MRDVSKATLAGFLAFYCILPSVAAAQKGGVQWSPDGLRVFVNKDVGSDRWSITMNLSDGTVTGNIFFAGGGDPGFIWCQKIGHNHAPSLSQLTLTYRCFGSDGAEGVFAVEDWNFVSDQVVLDATFFAPPAETCDVSGATNGPNAFAANSFWACSGPTQAFDFQAFDDGTGFSTARGSFSFAIDDGACGFGKLNDGSFFNVLYSPSRNRMNLYQTDAGVTRFLLSECVRVNL